MAIATDSKLTVKLPELLRRQAKAVAALRGETVSDVVREALEAYVAEVLEENEDIRIVQEVEARIAAGKEPIYSHQDMWAEVEALEAQGALPNSRACVTLHCKGKTDDQSANSHSPLP